MWISSPLISLLCGMFYQNISNQEFIRKFESCCEQVSNNHCPEESISYIYCSFLVKELCTVCYFVTGAMYQKLDVIDIHTY
jgi:hypothetical protein